MSFYAEIVKYYEVIFPLKPDKEAFVGDIIMSNKYDHLLDIGCATGALCGSMAKYLDSSKGFDLDEAMVRRANMFYKYNNIDFKTGDMLQIDSLYPEEVFDLVTCFGNTLVHVGKENIASIFKQVEGHLSDNGTFVLQILNYDHIFAKDIKVLPLIDNSTIRFERYYHYESQEKVAFETVLTIKESGQQLKNEISLYPISQLELDGWLRTAGFSDVTYYKNYKGDLYDGDHIPLIVLAKK